MPAVDHMARLFASLTANLHLDISPPGGEQTAQWLTGDEVQELATAVNPDGEGTSPGVHASLVMCQP